MAKKKKYKGLDIKNKIIIGFIIVIFLSILFMLVVDSPDEKDRGFSKIYEDSIKEINEEIVTIRESLDKEEATEEINDLNDSLKKLEKNILDETIDYEEVDEEIKELKKNIEKIKIEHGIEISDEEISEDKVNFTEVGKKNPNIEKQGSHHIKTSEKYKEIFGEESDIDFEKYDILAVFSGVKNTGGYSIEIISIEEKEELLEIYVEKKSPGEDCLVTMAITYPFDIVKIESSDKNVEFYYDEILIVC